MPSVTDSGERPASVSDAVDALRRASALPAKQRSVKVSGVVDTVCRYAFDHGLDADNLRAVVRIVSRKTELDQTSATTLIKNLYPAQRVSADVVITIVGGLGQGKGKPSLGTQNGLVKWLAIVREIIEEPSVLSRLYGVLFGMLDMLSIRTSLCHLLSLITRRKHVKPFRIQQLLELSRGIGNEPALQGLLRIYKDYYPDIILSNTATSRKSFPPLPEADWQERLLAIRAADTTANGGVLEQHNGFRVLRKGPKRSTVQVIPEVHTFRANETSVTLEEIDNASDFVDKLERIEPPGQMVSILSDPLLQKYVDLKDSPVASRRIELWLSTCLEEEYNAADSGLEASGSLPGLLDGLHQHTQYTKSLHPVVPKFLQSYLHLWDGATCIDAILGLLSYTSLQPFQASYKNYFAPAERALAGHGPRAYEKLLHFYKDLLQHWTNQCITSATKSEPLQDLVTHVSKLSTSLILSIPADSNSPLISSILTFYELLSSTPEPPTIPIILPPPYLCYLLAQSASVTTLSRICGIYANFKDAFDKHPTPISSYYPSTVTIPFNSCLRDLYNLLWGTKALLVVDKSPAFYCSPTLRDTLNNYLIRTEHEYAIGLAFGLSYNPWLSSLSASAWWALEEEEIDKHGYDRDSINWHKGPVTLQTLEALGKNRGVSVDLLEYKKYALLWMGDRGCDGLRALMFATHARLRK